MKTYPVMAVILALAVSAVQAAESKPAADADPFSRFSLGLYLSYWDAQDLGKLDLDGTIGGALVGQVQLWKHLALDLRAGGFGAGESEDLYIPDQGWTDNYTSFFITPLEAGLIACLPLGNTYSLYGGGGAGYYFIDGQYSIDQGPWTSIYDMELDDESGFYALLGGKAQLANNIAAFLETKYTWVETSWDGNLAAAPCPAIANGAPCPPRRHDEKIDFSGLAVNLGMLFTF